MRLFRSPVKSILLSVGCVLFPLAATAAVPVSDVLRMTDSAPVSRGEFIRAAVKVLGVTGNEKAILPYRRVPRDLESQVKAAYAAGALKTFGEELFASQPITRGQALEIIVSLQHFTAKATTQYRDARTSDALAQAVQVAVDQGWMEPQSNTLFGVQEVLTGKEARLFLRKVLGQGGEQEDETDTIPTVEIRFTPSKKTTSTSTLPKAQILEALWNLIEEDYLYSEKIDADATAYEAAEAIVKSLGDPYSTFYRPAGARAFQSRIQGEVSGIGAQVEDREGVLTITTPLTNSPAEKAGLKPNDQIIAVDGTSILGLPYEEMVDYVRGPKGSIVKLRIRRSGVEFDVQVTRDTIKVPEIEIKWQEEIAVVKLMQFGKLSETDLRPEMQHVQEQDPKGIILDLRNNPGGLLHAATIVASNFLPKGSSVAIIRSRTGDRTERTEDEPTIDASVPVVILVNGGSASASEIVAAALQDAKRVTVIGEQTFGKGTVQEVLEFTDKSSLKLTIAEWLSPLGHTIDGVGVTPDTVVPTAERDEQMTRAIAILKAARR
ncbi:MAG: S41 family peptidase [Candidatus Peribacteraceae bacterium]|nr:S41 family peptidase [Candidatus Peribacteraceae bacterium]MDD5739760.1 S41 family peptidase [Candidatus Peribacteraceae bacterium]